MEINGGQSARITAQPVLGKMLLAAGWHLSAQVAILAGTHKLSSNSHTNPAPDGSPSLRIRR